MQLRKERDMEEWSEIAVILFHLYRKKHQHFNAETAVGDDV